MRKKCGGVTLKAWQRAVSEYDLIMRALAADALEAAKGQKP